MMASTWNTTSKAKSLNNSHKNKQNIRKSESNKSRARTAENDQVFKKKKLKKNKNIKISLIIRYRINSTAIKTTIEIHLLKLWPFESKLSDFTIVLEEGDFLILVTKQKISAKS